MIECKSFAMPLSDKTLDIRLLIRFVGIFDSDDPEEDFVDERADERVDERDFFSSNICIIFLI
jgi:hypothetical protein